MSEYPAPIHPWYLERFKEKGTSSSPEALLPVARDRILRWYGRGGMHPLGAGDRILIVTYPHQDPVVVEAMTLALKEFGAETVDSVNLAEIGLEVKDYSAADGHREITDRLDSMLDDGVEFSVEASVLSQYVQDAPHYTAIFAGEAGRPYWRRATSDAFRNNWMFSGVEALVTREHSFPDSLWQLIDELVVERFSDAAKVRVVDPQGTDISWSVTPEQARRWADGALLRGHILGLTTQGIRYVYGADEFVQDARVLLPSLNGVICGTGNHTGYYPQIEVTIESGMIASVRGGGKYGELLRSLVARFADAQYPGFPYPGWAYLNEVSIGTNPKAHRQVDHLWSSSGSWTNLAERTRAGVVHFGFGAEHWDRSFVDYAQANGLPTVHFPHVHVYFPTYLIMNHGSSEWVPLIDKGRLCVLDDPRVVRLASLYGDPADVLGYEWVPAIPGINYEGDYQQDYGDDPVAWIARDQQGEFAPRP